MRFLSNSEKKELNELLPSGLKFDKKDEIIEEKEIILKNSEKFLIILNKNKKEITKVIPHLKSINEKSQNDFKSVFIDSGAIPFLIKGADMMRPGIHKIEKGIKKDEIILIKDLEYEKVLAIGSAIYTAEEMENQQKGISVKVLHYVGDNKF
jgi:PUA domain protein